MTPENSTNMNSNLESLLTRLPAPPPASAEFQNELRSRVLDEYDHSFNSPPVEIVWRRTIHKGVVIMSHPISRAIAAVAATVLVIIWLTVPGQSIALGDLLEPIINAKSAKFKMTTKNDVQPEEFKATGYFRAPNRFRNEFTTPKLSQMVTIADFDRSRMMTLIPDKKEAMIFELKNMPADSKSPTNNFFNNLRATLADYRDNKRGWLEELPEKYLDGRRAFGFRLTTTGMVQTIWGDAATGQLIQVEATYNGPPKSEVVMTDFEFDVPLDESLFSLDVPAGYKTTSIPIDASPATEQDFLASLRRLIDATDGEFPLSLDTPGIAKAMAKLLKNTPSKEQMTEGGKIARGLTFVMILPPNADAHYAGKGLKREGPKSVLFWYKPVESKQYCVIWSDLSTTDAETAPEVPGAIRLVAPTNKPKTGD
jgi:outer membrane lipoprotein-sorting protein